MVILLEILGALKLWLPLVTVVGIVVKAYFGAKRAITDWADTLVNNHMAHIQAALEAITAAVKEQSEAITQELREQRQDIRNLGTVVAVKHVS